MTTQKQIQPTHTRAKGNLPNSPWGLFVGSTVLLITLSACGGGSDAPEAPASTSLDGTARALVAPAADADRSSKVIEVFLQSSAQAPPAPVAAGYYVDAVTGADSNPGTIKLPWRTLARLKGVTLKPNEGFYLRCGQTWRESLILDSRELVDNSVVAGYGPDCDSRKAVISGANVFTGRWQFANGIWSLALPAGTPKITQLFINSLPMHTARWPNRDAEILNVVQTANTVSAKATASQKVMLRTGDAINFASRNLVGATVQLRTQPWLIETRKVIAQSGASVLLNKATDWDVKANQNVVLEDQLWMLDSPGEFFHDVQRRRLHLKAPATSVSFDPNRATIEGSVRDLALAAKERSGLTIRNIEVRATRVDGIRLTDTPRAQLHHIEAHHNLGAGIRLWQWVPLPAAAIGQPGLQVADSLVTSSGEIGIDARYVDRSQIRRVVVKGTGTGPQHSSNVLAAIAAGHASIVTDSQVDESAYIGIRFSAVGGSAVTRNTVSGYCLRLTDCGAIYTWNGHGSLLPATHSVVESNRIFGADPLNTVARADGSDVIVGVYIDDISDGVTVNDNTIFGAPTGILVHNASRTTVTANRIWLPSRVGIFATMDDRNVDRMHSNRFENNQISPLVSIRAEAGSLPEFKVAQAFWFWHWRSGTAALAAGRNSFVNNSVLQYQGPLAAHAWLRGPDDERYIDALDWQALNPAEAAVSRPLRFDTLQVETGPELVLNGHFENGLSSWRTWQHPSSRQFEAQPNRLRSGCENACVDFTSGHRTDLLASAPFQMKPGVPHVYRWKAVMPIHSGASVAWPYVSRESSPWDAMWNSQGFSGYGPLKASAAETLKYEMFFIPKSADASRVNLQLDTPGVTVGMDNVSVRQVTGYTTAQLSDWAAIAYAPANAPKTWNCSDFGWAEGCLAAGEGGQSVELPLTVEAGGMQILLRTDSSFASTR